MQFRTTLILFILYCILACRVATSPQTLDTINNNTTNATLMSNLPQASRNSKLAIKVATRRLILHNDFMRIVYLESVPLPNPLYRRVLSTAYHRIAHMKDIVGEETIVYIPINVRDLNVMFQAGSDRHSASEDLTWGILEEAIEVLQDFMLQRPYALEAVIIEGLDGRGIPLGQVAVEIDDGPDDLATTQAGDV